MTTTEIRAIDALHRAQAAIDVAIAVCRKEGGVDFGDDDNSAEFAAITECHNATDAITSARQALGDDLGSYYD